MINVKNVYKTYKDGTHAINGISVNIAEGEFVYVVGPTGSGKSTLIKLLNSEEVPDKGEIIVDGVNVGKLKLRKVPIYRRRIGVVFQDYQLLEAKTVFENVAFALEVVDTPKEKLRARVREVLRLVGLSDKANSFPNKISGGQKQRTAIARAIANKPKVLIADEPTGNLDPETSDEIIRLLERINEEENTTILLVTHDTEIVKNHPKRIIQIENGLLAADIPANEAEFRMYTLMTKRKSEDKPEIDDRTVEQVVKEEIIDKRVTDEISSEDYAGLDKLREVTMELRRNTEELSFDKPEEE